MSEPKPEYTVAQLEKQNKREVYQDVSRCLANAEQELDQAARLFTRLEKYIEAAYVEKLSEKLQEVKNE